jgi:3-hydroxybutyryl-CoA dehydrogenase
MTASGLQQLVVIGAGVLGGQIAWHSAFKGKSVVVYDPFEESLDRCRAAQDQYALIYQQDLAATADDIAATRDRLTLTTKLADAAADADLVIEAAPEIPDVKSQLYRDLSEHLPERTIIATNSSTLLPSQFADDSGRPDRFCCLHFANLIWSMNLAEVMAHPGTSRETILSVTRFAIEIGMVPVPLQKEHSAYVINSLLIPLLQAAQTLVTNGISTPETVDRTYMIMNRGCSHGPFGVIDIVGMETCYNILSYWGAQNDDEQMLANAEYIKTHFIDQGHMGLQTGQGYYHYPDPAYQAADFLEVPDISQAQAIADLVGAG